MSDISATRDFWTRNKIIELIEEYRNARCLWDVKGHKLEERQERIEALNNIAKSLGCETTVAEKKIHTLYSQYRREYAKVNKRIEEGKEPEEISHSTWFGYKYMQFLDHKIKKSENKTKKEGDNSKRKRSEEPVSLKFAKIEVDDETLHEHYEDENDHDNNDDEDEEETYLIENVQPRNRKRLADNDDECSMFGELLAMKLRKLDPLTRLDLQYKIDSLVYNTEKEILKKNSGR